ncbi:MAG: endolytic transglycosylase MltG [Methyloligellaceae bacterium]
MKVRFDEPGPLAHSTVVVIPRGESTSAIAARLEQEGIISDRRIFMASIRYFQFRSSKKLKAGIKAGEYEIRNQASMRDVLDALIDGRVVPHKVSIPEGLTSAQIVARLQNAPILTGEISAVPPEGSLLPDTYLITRGSSRQDLLARMQSAQKKFIKKLWPTRAPNLPFKTVEEALVLASIVEKETGRSDERRQIAGVFVNRLRRNIRLQSDPTIIYGITAGKGPLRRPILRSEINKVTPYNTYQIDGLPPTPIANPGRASIEAVLSPESTPNLYFVADGSGGHVFAKSLKEHNKNVAKWRVVEREIRARQKAARKESEKAAKAVQPEGRTVAEGGGANPSTIVSENLSLPPRADAAPLAGFPGLVVSGGNVARLGAEVSQGTDVATVKPPSAVPSSTAVAKADSRKTLAPDIPLPVRKPRRN